MISVWAILTEMQHLSFQLRASHAKTCVMVTGAAGCGSLGWVYPKLGIILSMSIQLPTYLTPKFLETKLEVETQATRFSGFLKLPG